MAIKQFKAYTKKYQKISREIKEKVIISANKEMYPKSTSGEYICLFDTGATSSAISTKIARECNLTAIDRVKVNTASGVAVQDVYLVDIELPTGLIPNIRATAMEEINGTDVLIGMDIITLGDFVITNYNNKTTFSFRIPSCETIDYCKEADKTNVKILKNLLIKEKNKGKELCYCGSRKRYRYCHGKEIINKLEEEIKIIEDKSKKEIINK